jgi:hypothetical protein
MKYENLSKDQQLAMVNSRITGIEQQHFDAVLAGEATLRSLSDEDQRKDYQNTHKARLKELDDQHKFLLEQKASLEK